MTTKPWGLWATVASALLSTSVAQTGPFLIDIDSTVLVGNPPDNSGTIATEAGWASLDATAGNASVGVTVDGVTFTLGSADGSRVRESDGAPDPNALTGDFVYDDGPNEAVILYFGGTGALPAGPWEVTMWIWDETSPFGNVIVGYRTNNTETIVTESAVSAPDAPAASFVFESDGAAAYDVFVRENNSQNRARLCAVSLTRPGPSDLRVDPGGISPAAPASTTIGDIVPTNVFASAGYTYELVAGEGDTDNAQFAILGDELQTSASWSGSTLGTILSIRVRATAVEGSVTEFVIPIPVITDTDNDGLDDDWERSFFGDDLSVATGQGNNDNDALINFDEFLRDTFPNDEDSDDDLLNDDLEDNGGSFNGPSDPGTDPRDDDTDDDDVNDGQELVDGTNPLVADIDGDGLNDGQEKALGTRPDLADTDGDGLSDGAENGVSNPLDPTDPPATATLCAYWPLDGFDAMEMTTPDLGPGGYALDLEFMGAANFVNDGGRDAASFNGVDTMLTRLHDPADELPINKHTGYTVAMWVNIKGTGQNDLRFFAEASSTDNVPLFNMGTRNTGADDRFDLYMVGSSATGHQLSDAAPLDGTWRHLALTSNAPNEKIEFYIDGVLDRDSFNFTQIPGMDTTSIGGIAREARSHWVQGLVDDVALWKKVLTPEEIAELAAGTSPLDIGRAGGFTITDVTFDGTDVTLRWNSTPGRIYAVFASKDLAVGSWGNYELTDNAISTGISTTFVWPDGMPNPDPDPASERTLLFRVEDRGPAP